MVIEETNNHMHLIEEEDMVMQEESIDKCNFSQFNFRVCDFRFAISTFKKTDL